MNVQCVSLKCGRSPEQEKCQRALCNLFAVETFFAPQTLIVYPEGNIVWLRNLHTHTHTKSESLCAVEVWSQINGSPSSLASLSVLGASPAQEEGGSHQSSCPSVWLAVTHTHTHTHTHTKNAKHTPTDRQRLRYNKVDTRIYSHTAMVPQVCPCSNEDLLALLTSTRPSGSVFSQLPVEQNASPY